MIAVMEGNNKQFLLGAGAILAVLLSIYVIVLSVKEWKSIKYVGGQNNLNYITVTGEGEEVAIPDLATFSFGVTETAKTVNVARDAAALKINKALEIAKKAGVLETDIKNVGYSINPKYEYAGSDCNMYRCVSGKQTFVGYEVAQTIEVRVRDLTKVGQLITDVTASGVESVGSISFMVEKQDELKTKAREMAIKQAKQKAEDLADALGVRLVRVSSFSENGYFPYYAKGGDMMEASISARPVAAPTIPTGDQKITSNVNITYEIR